MTRASASPFPGSERKAGGGGAGTATAEGAGGCSSVGMSCRSSLPILRRRTCPIASQARLSAVVGVACSIAAASDASRMCAAACMCESASVLAPEHRQGEASNTSQSRCVRVLRAPRGVAPASPGLPCWRPGARGVKAKKCHPMAMRTPKSRLLDTAEARWKAGILLHLI
jgi:hypothetical protein